MCDAIKVSVKRHVQITLPGDMADFITWLDGGIVTSGRLSFSFHMLTANYQYEVGMEADGDDGSTYNVHLLLQSPPGVCVPFVPLNEEHLLHGLDALHAEWEKKQRPARVIVTQ